MTLAPMRLVTSSKRSVHSRLNAWTVKSGAEDSDTLPELTMGTRPDRMALIAMGMIKENNSGFSGGDGFRAAIGATRTNACDGSLRR